MEQKGKGRKVRVVLGFITFLSASTVFAVNNAYRVVDGPSYFYYGHISYSDVRHDGLDPVVFRQGSKAPEPAVVNLPLGPGDLVKTPEGRRCEIQFDNGSIVRLDGDTEFKIETILAPSLSSRSMISNLVLDRGQVYVMFKKYDSRELFQVLTPLAALKLSHNSVAVIRTLPDKTAEVQVEEGEARLMFGPADGRLEEKKINKHERWVVTAENRAEPSEYFASSDFIAWNKTVNENFNSLHGESFLPKPVERYPLAVRHFAQKYGNPYGEWLWDSLYGYIWRPFYNDAYPTGNWMPYVYGRWTFLNNQFYWVPEEPWGWVPYHLGIWTWDKTKGWFWIPGSFFSPAWVNWFVMDDFFGWRPWSLFDWYDEMWMAGLAGGYFGSISGAYGGSVYLGDDTGGGWTGIETFFKIRKDQLKKNTPRPPMSKEIRAVFKKAVMALKKGDVGAIDSIRALPGATRVVKRSDIRGAGLRERTISLDRFAGIARSLPARTPLPLPRPVPSVIGREAFTKTESDTAPGLKAGTDRGTARLAGSIRAGSDLRIRSSAVSARSLSSRPEFSLRIRDFNPDARLARGQGVSLSYNSRINGIVAPGLNVRRVVSESNLSSASSGGSSGGNWGSGSGSSSAGSASSGGSASGGTGAGSSSSSSQGSGSSRAGSRIK